jgi:hypothetical protein
MGRNARMLPERASGAEARCEVFIQINIARIQL